MQKQYHEHVQMEAVAVATPLIATKCMYAMAMFLLCSNVATGPGPGLLI